MNTRPTKKPKTRSKPGKERLITKKVRVNHTEDQQIKNAAELCGYKKNVAHFIRLLVLGYKPDPISPKVDNQAVLELLKLRFLLEKEMKWRQVTLDRYDNNAQKKIKEANERLSSTLDHIDRAALRIGASDAG